MTQLSYNDTGGKRPIIVFIHGLGSRKEAWKAQQTLSTRFRLISVDLRGHGETAENKDLTVKNFASDVIDLIDSLKIKSAFFCGLSLGGFVVQEIHCQRSDLIKGLILASTTSYIPGYYIHGAIHEATRAFNNGSLLDNIVKRGLVDKSFSEDARDAFHIRENYLEAATAAFGLNYFPHLYTIRKPVLIIGGSCDKVIPVVNVSLMKFCIRNCESVILRDSGHLCNIESADQFNDCVDTFVNKHY